MTDAVRPDPNVSGNIAILGVDNKYMKVVANDRVEFGNQKYDDTAKFEVMKFDDGKISLKGSNGKVLRMYYTSDVTCEGNGGGVKFGIIYLADDMINFTVSGYQGQGNRTKYLSSQAGGVSYNGSLAVKEFEDVTCRFKIQNLD